MENKDMALRSLYGLCEKLWKETPSACLALPASGGDRRYFRLDVGGRMVLGAVADKANEAEAYVRLTKVFRDNGVHVPEVYIASPDYSCYLVEDLGDVSLYSILYKEGSDGLIELSLRELVRMQTVPEREWSTAAAYPPLSRRQVMWDLNYFKYEFLKNVGVDFDEEALEDDFERLAGDILSVPENQQGFMMRDCQSRNIMVAKNKNEEPTPYFIDFQGGRRGPLLYDAVSMLWQAKAGFSMERRGRFLRIYAGALARVRGIDEADILGNVGKIALFRTLQVLGAYGYRGLVQHRAHFIESIPGAITNLVRLKESGEMDAYPVLKELAGNFASLEKFRPSQSDRLEVKVFSFSYKRGYPEDYTGNGGGFMFDCRGMHNPGRYAEYKTLTGRDAPVIEFLKTRGEADDFARKAVEITAPTVERYLKRGFSSLQIGFGCTGGQHRSVYCAEALAHELARRFPTAVIKLCHREQNIEEILNGEPTE